MKKEEALSLLEMTEEKAVNWLEKNGITKFHTFYDDEICTVSYRESLADCAFRLRDEAIAKHGFVSYRKALREIYNRKWDSGERLPVFEVWAISEATEKIMIVAALLTEAKE